MGPIIPSQLKHQRNGTYKKLHEKKNPFAPQQTGNANDETWEYQ